MKQVVLFFSLFLCLFFLNADRLILEGDRVLEGIVIEEEHSYRLITPYSVISLKKDQVTKVEKETDPQIRIENILSQFIEKEQYKEALLFLQRCREEELFGLALFYRYLNRIEHIKNEREFEQEVLLSYKNEEYQRLIDLVENYMTAYPGYALSSEFKEILIDAYTQMSFRYIDYIQFDRGYMYLNKAFQLAKDSPKVREILVLYAERTGRDIIIEREKQHEEILIARQPIARPHFRDIEIPEEVIDTTEELYKEELLYLMLQAYNAGPAALLAYQGNVLYRETQEYVVRVKNHLQSPNLTTPHDELVYLYANKYRLDPQFIKAVLLAESSGRSQAVSPQGARGLMQIMKGTWNDMTRYIGVQWPYQQAFEPAKNIEIGCAYFAWLRDDFIPLFFNLP